jgi:hypothetical protein
MSLDEKTINPLAPAELPGQNSDLLPKSGKKRRKSEGGSRKTKKVVEEDGDDSADVTAVLTMGDAARKQPKKMLFEPVADSGPVSLPTPVARRENGSTRAALSGTAAVMPSPVPTTVPTPVSVAPAPMPIAPAAPIEIAPEEPKATQIAQPPAEPDPQPIADMKGSVFQVATLRMREPDPAPMPESTEPSQPSFDLEAPSDSDEAEQSMIAAAEPVHDLAADSPETPVEELLAPSETETVAALDPEPTPTFAEPADDDIAVAAAPTPSLFEPTVAEAPATPETIEVAAPVAQPALVPPTPASAPAPIVEPEAPARLSRSEMIARSARMSALSSSRTNGSAAAALAPRPVAPPTPPHQQRPTELPKHAGDLYGYWTRVKNGRRFPSRADFDVEQMAENFPNSMLLTCGANGGSQVNFSSILRLGANRRAQPGEALSFTSMITEWILAIGGEAVRAGTPVQDTEVFPAPDGTFAYKIVALPLSDQQTRVEHVLCHLSRS